MGPALEVEDSEDELNVFVSLVLSEHRRNDSTIRLQLIASYRRSFYLITELLLYLELLRKTANMATPVDTDPVPSNRRKGK